MNTPKIPPRREAARPPLQRRCAHPLLQALTYLFGLLIVLSSPFSTAADKPLYKITDEQGRIHFSDKKPAHPRYEKLERAPVQGYSAPQPPRDTSRNNDRRNNANQQPTTINSYQQLAIVSPADQHTLQNVDIIPVRLALQPELAAEHLLRIKVNGTESGPATRELTHLVPIIERGEFKLQAEVIDKTGKVFQSSAIVTVHLKRFSKLFPKKSGN